MVGQTHFMKLSQSVRLRIIDGGECGKVFLPDINFKD